MSAHPAVGSRWLVGGVTYRVESTNGPDCQYPIVMREVAREAHIDQHIRAAADATPAFNREFVLSGLKPRSMDIEARWFDRADVREVRP